MCGPLFQATAAKVTSSLLAPTVGAAEGVQPVSILRQQPPHVLGQRGEVGVEVADLGGGDELHQGEDGDGHHHRLGQEHHRAWSGGQGGDDDYVMVCISPHSLQL